MQRLAWLGGIGFVPQPPRTREQRFKVAMQIIEEALDYREVNPYILANLLFRFARRCVGLSVFSRENFFLIPNNQI